MHTLTTLDPHAPLDDLALLREIAGDARVVAIGENAHFVEEFSLARQRVLRFLAEECGFTVFAYEFGFSEAFALDRWLRGEGDDDLAAVNSSAAEWGSAGLMHWLRQHNTDSGHPLRFVGIDVPEAGGALRPALEPVAEYLREVDPDSLPLVEVALDISDRFCGGSAAAAAPAWAQLDVATQNALTAVLARLLLRMRGIEPLCVDRSDQARFDVARRQVEAACHTDYMFGAMSALFAGQGIVADTSVREIYMAESVRWHLDNSGGRIVLAAHNNHIQKTHVEFDRALTAFPMGQHLARMLGDDYRSIAVTHTADHVPEMYPDASAPVGFTLSEATLPAPEPGSVEAALVDAGLGGEITLTDVRGSAFTGIRTQSAVLHTPIADAFDAVLSVPTVTRDPSVRF